MIEIIGIYIVGCLIATVFLGYKGFDQDSIIYAFGWPILIVVAIIFLPLVGAYYLGKKLRS
jgi:hypothetical protein